MSGSVQVSRTSGLSSEKPAQSRTNADPAGQHMSGSSPVTPATKPQDRMPQDRMPQDRMPSV